MIYLVNFKNEQKDNLAKQDNTNNGNSIFMLQWSEIVALIIVFIFGTTFWISLMGMIFRRKTTVKNIFSTNAEIKVSAFLDI